jgi:hypothetical protein
MVGGNTDELETFTRVQAEFKNRATQIPVYLQREDCRRHQWFTGDKQYGLRIGLPNVIKGRSPIFLDENNVRRSRSRKI